jgi:hypothetical protein
MSKKANLVTALHEASGKKPASFASTIHPDPPAATTAASEKPQSRVGKKVIAGHFDPAVIRQIKILAVNQDSSIQALLTEAMNDLFEKHNLKPIA